MSVNKIVTKVDGIINKTINFNDLASGLSVGSHTITVEAYNGATLISTQTKNITIVAEVVYEAETTSYMNAIGIPDDNTIYYANTPQEIAGAAIWTSVDTFVAALKTNSILNKMKAIYPFIGGTAVTHKWNLMNPQDTDAAYRLVFFGSWNHSKTGMQGNGNNTYANTKAVHNSIFTEGSESFGVYLRSEINENKTAIGVFDSDSGSSYFYSYYRGSMLSRSQAKNSIRHVFANISTLGMHLMNRSSSSTYRIRKRDQIFTGSEPATSLTNLEIPISARNSVGIFGNFSSKETSFSFMGEGLTPTEENNLVIAINQLQTDLKRNVV